MTVSTPEDWAELGREEMRRVFAEAGEDLAKLQEPEANDTCQLEHGYKLRLQQDYVLVQLDPLTEKTASGIELVRDRKSAMRETRIGTVLAVGPGYWAGCKHCSIERRFVPTSVQKGDRVALPFLCGADWSLDRMAPRHIPKGVEWETFPDVGQETITDAFSYTSLRIVREGEIFAVL